MRKEIASLVVFTGILILLYSCKHSNENPAPVVPTLSTELCSSCNVSNITGQYALTPVFSNTERIVVPVYYYIDSSLQYTFSGDSTVHNIPGGNMPSYCCEAITYLNKLPPTPTFSWVYTGDSIIACAIFSGRISLENNERVNSSNAVWMWNSGLNTGTYSNGNVQIQYGDGRAVINGVMQENASPGPLQINQCYTWMVWAWDSQGLKIVKSSLEIPFIVGSGVLTAVTLSDTNEIKGAWILNQATRSNGTNVTSSYPIRQIIVNSSSSVEFIKSDSTKEYSSISQLLDGALFFSTGEYIGGVIINCQSFGANMQLPGDTSQVLTEWSRF
jgi:hypothetical protein